MPQNEPRFYSLSEREREFAAVFDMAPTPGRVLRSVSDAWANHLAADDYVRRFPAGQQADYNINVPGVFDVIRIPSLEDRSLRRDRYLRWKNSVSPLPEALQWIPGVINILDDAQDLLYTALFLARPLLRRLPRFFLGPLGWILLGNDLLNLGT